MWFRNSFPHYRYFVLKSLDLTRRPYANLWRALVSVQPLFSEHLTFPQGWPLNRGSISFYKPPKVEPRSLPIRVFIQTSFALVAWQVNRLPLDIIEKEVICSQLIIKCTNEQVRKKLYLMNRREIKNSCNYHSEFRKIQSNLKTRTSRFQQSKHLHLFYGS